MTETKPKRRWFRFSLRTLFLVMLVLCVWLGFKVNAARRQHEAVEAIQPYGRIVFDFQLVSVPGNPAPQLDMDISPPGPAWLRRLVGDDCFRHAATVTFLHTSIPEPAFAQLANLPDLKSVAVIQGAKLLTNDSNTRPVNDDDLTVVGQISCLEELVLMDADVHAAGLASLAKLKHLRSLRLVAKDIDDEAMEQIGKTSTLERLVLICPSIKDSGIQMLKSLSRLRTVELHRTLGLKQANSEWFRGKFLALSLAHG